MIVELKYLIIVFLQDSRFLSYCGSYTSLSKLLFYLHFSGEQFFQYNISIEYFYFQSYTMNKIHTQFKEIYKITFLGRIDTTAIYKIPHDISIMYYIYDIIHQFAHVAYYHILVHAVKTLLDKRISCSLFYTKNRYRIRNFDGIVRWSIFLK